MCGISGAVGAIDDEIRAAVGRMHDAQVHRGPDADGRWEHSERGVGACFAHRRLSILDLSPLGRQPMRHEPSGHVVCFNGEIYGFQSLRRELAARGERFRSQSDTEVILAGYATWGRDVLARLRGMFAFALWDARSRTVLLARDRLGIKPLYLAEVERPGGERVVLFASEVRSILASSLVSRRIDPLGLSSFLWNGVVATPSTIVRGVRLLEEGTSVTIDEHGHVHDERRYWQVPRVPTAAGSPTAQSESVRELRRVLKETLEQHILSDVPLGVFLSGGLDSSVIAALAHQRLSRRGGKPRLQAFCIAFEEASFDESAHARAVSSHLGLEHVERVLSPHAMLDVVDEVLHHLDEPLGDHSIVPTYLLCRLASQHVKVALGGDGADELFGGYPTYVAHARHARALAPLVRAARAAFGSPSLGRLLDRVPASDGYQSLDWKLKRFVGRWDDDVARRHLRWMSSLDLPALAEVMGPRLHGEPATLREGSHWWGDPIATATTLDFATYMPGSVLTKVDRASMAHGLEARPPFLDEGVLALARRLPSAAKVRGSTGKVLLRQAARSLVPAAILERKKHGFSVPLASWLRGPLAPRLDAILEDSPVWTALDRAPFARWRDAHRSRRGEHAKALWALLVLDRWMRKTGVLGDLPARSGRG